MKQTVIAVSGALILSLLPAAAHAGDLGAAISPAARAVALPSGGTAAATTYATVINNTDRALGNCEVSLPGRFGDLRLDYAWTDPSTNALVAGSENVPFSLAPRASQSLVLAITADAVFDGVVPPVFECADSTPADPLYGVNTLELVVSDTPPVDILAIGVALPDNDGVIRIASEGGTQAMAVAAINIGAAGNVTVRPEGVYGQNADLPADLTICETAPDSQCLAAPSAQLILPFSSDEVRTFAVFARAWPGSAIPLDPANSRVEVRFLVNNQLAAAASAAIAAPGPDFQVSSRDALRLAQQATFGANQTLIENIRRTGLEPWIDQQLAMTDSTYQDLATELVSTNFCRDMPNQCRVDHFTAFRLQMRFFQNAMSNPDQLRQRVAWALSQILVVSEHEVEVNYALARYQQMLLENAFGNYRDILEGVAQSPTMGDYLDMVNSSASAPNENFPRELMQLFSLGEARLNRDGTPVLDGTGRIVPAYTEDDVLELSRALTGWVYPTRPNELPSFNNPRYYDADMSVYATEHDSDQKTFLGVGLIGGQSADADLEQVIDIIFNHSNVPPFVSRQLIQHLVTSNPSPAYVERVAAVFENNGQGERGDLRAVVRAILTDTEARNPDPDPSRAGKLREPVLLLTSIMRLVGAETDGYAFLRRLGGMHQIPFEAHHVFNFYPPDYGLPGSDSLVSPSQALINMSTVFERHNVVYDWTYNGNENRWDWRPTSNFEGATGTQVDWSSWGRLAQNPGLLLNVLDEYALEEDLTPEQRQLIMDAMAARTYWGDPLEESRRRARLAIYLIVTSPYFQIDH
ncbi:DUF1800 domain-containing protein [Hyphobacterium sp. HN65]|uniref:DUF1800 domain-containing protein n=1 Tax=Hyphobacterium lacteum TaxID=3116575 RepID=A0ABU7LQ59_9PROT|nr:DUF1800 domain-containing protein [Hyphobacterium sp. HN65]MEE2526037.1 DUF1800 domain-containing protein [Hyphobacterium sp. HN65]